MDITNNKKALGQRIRELRQRKGLSQEKLAEMVGMEPPSICYIENGRNYPALQNLEKIINALNTTFSEVFIFDKYQDSGDLLYEINRILNENPQKIREFYKIIKALTE